MPVFSREYASAPGRVERNNTPFKNLRIAELSNYGTVVSNTIITATPGTVSLFGTLEIQDVNDATRERVSRRRRLEDGKTLRQNITYIPYVEVNLTNIKVKKHLLQAARRFQFIDHGFAEYFQRVLPSFGKAYVRQRLADVREQIAGTQPQAVAKLNCSGAPVLGDLGHFCEDVARQWTEPGPEPKFTTTHGRSHEVLHYLRDALEVPYWEFMLDLFSEWRANSKTLSGDVVLRVLNSVKLDILAKRRQLDTLKHLETDDNGLAAVLRGIDLRLEVLESVWDDATSDSALDDMLATVFDEKATGTTVATMRHDNETSASEGENSQHETVMLVAISLVFLTAAIVPGYKGFAISMQENSKGSIADADFWYLIQSNIMAVLGNLAMVIPLMRKSWFSPAYTWMWAFFTAGVVFSVVSIAIFPFFNTGWSSILAFFGSVASASSVLVMTQATVRPSHEESGKEKKKTE